MPPANDPHLRRPGRRELPVYGWLALLMAVGARLLLALRTLAAVRPGPGEIGGVFDVQTEALSASDGEFPFDYPVGRFWLVNDEQGLLALSKVCTHLDCLLSWEAETGVFACPCHGSRFATDGVYLEGPAPRSMDRFALRVVDPAGAVMAETDETGAPLSFPPLAAGVPDAAALHVQVDTGRLIRGDPSA